MSTPFEWFSHRPDENVDILGDEYDAMKIIHALHRIKNVKEKKLSPDMEL